MKIILYIPCSPHGPASHSLAFAEEVIARLRQHYPAAAVPPAALAADAPSFVDATFSKAILDPARSQQAFAQSEALIQELESADAIVIATPIHNFIVPAVLTAWID